MQPTLFDENPEDIAAEVQKKAWAFLQHPYTESVKLGNETKIYEAILITAARKAIKNQDVKAMEFLLKIVLRVSPQSDKGDGKKAVSTLNDWCQSIENESLIDVPNDNKDAPGTDSVGEV
jgi:hypothetical protein